MRRLNTSTLAAYRGVLFAGCDDEETFRSFDNGDHWEPADNGLTKAPVTLKFYSFDSDLYEVTRDVSLIQLTKRLHVSRDSGKTWTELFYDATGADITAVLKIGDKLLVGSLLGGHLLSLAGQSATTCTGFGRTFDVGIGRHLFRVGQHVPGVYRSDDSGRNWSLSDNGIDTNDRVRCLTLLNNRVFAGRNGASIGRPIWAIRAASQ